MIYTCKTHTKRQHHTYSQTLMLASTLILMQTVGVVGATLVTGFSYSYFLLFREHRSLLVVFLLLPKSPSGPPWNEGHWPRVRHETSVFEVRAQEPHEHSFYSSSTNTFITCSLYTVHRYRISPGAPDLGTRLD